MTHEIQKPKSYNIPQKPEKVDISRLRGDVGAIIEYELSGNENYFNDLPAAEALRAAIKKGSRVFMTENDDFLIVDPLPEPLQDSQES